MGFSHVKVTLKILASNGDDFTDSFYRAASTLAEAKGAADLLCEKRRIPMTDDWAVVGADIRPAPKPGEDTTRGVLHTRTAAGKGGFLLSKRDTGGAVMLVRMQAGSHSRSLALHGNPDSVISFTNAGADNTSLGNEGKAFLDQLVGGGWQMRVLTVPFNAAANKKVANITVAANSVITFSVDPGVQLAPGSKFIVSAAKGYHAGQFDGTWRVGVHDLAGKTIMCSTRRRIDSTFFYELASATFRVEDAALIDFPAFTGYDSANVRSATHKVGNVVERRRGRRSAAR